MELKSTVQFSKEIDGRLYTFTMAANAPVGEAYDVLFDCLRKVVEISNKNVEKMAREAEEKLEDDEEVEERERPIAVQTDVNTN